MKRYIFPQSRVLLRRGFISFAKKRLAIMPLLKYKGKERTKFALVCVCMYV